MEPIPLSRPDFDEEEIESVARMIRSGRIGADGPLTRDLENRMEEYLGVERVLLTTSGTHSLELAFLAADLKQGDEVICPSFTFVSTANAALRCFARPVFADIEPATLNISPEDVERRITPRTRAICPVHYAGISCRMDDLRRIAEKHDLIIVEDAAHAIGSRYKGTPLGTIGELGCYSFHDTKNIVCGEGGALATNVPEYADRAEIVREKGTDRSRFMRGEVDKYTWHMVGSSYVISEVLVAILDVQWRKMERINARRVELFNRYMAGLADLAASERIRLPHVPADCTINGHIFYVIHPDGDDRDRCMQELSGRGIRATFHFLPLNRSPFAEKYLDQPGESFPVSETMSERLLRLPIFSTLRDDQVDFIIDIYRQALSNR